MNKVSAQLIYKLIIAAVVAAAIGVGGWILYKEVFSKDSSLKIDDTANVVDKISKIGEFTSTTYYEEQVLKNAKLTSFALSSLGKYVNSESTDELVFIASGHVRAGFDLKKVSSEDVEIVGDTISIVLPQPEIFDVIMNPSDFEVYVESGEWSHEEIQKIQHEGKTKLRQHAVEEEILVKAKESGLRKLTALFKTFGFAKVILNTEK